MQVLANFLLKKIMAVNNIDQLKPVHLQIDL